MISFRAIGLVAFGVLGALSMSAVAGELRLESVDVRPGESIASAHVFDGFGCTGKNRSPALRWGSVPEGTKSIAITVYDPDAPTGSGWWHWLVYNIPAGTTEIASGAGASGGVTLPQGARMGRNDFGAYAYGGPCPPPGNRAHRYLFSVHALKIEKLELPVDASAAMIGFMINSNSIASARLIATFGRSAR